MTRGDYEAAPGVCLLAAWGFGVATILSDPCSKAYIGMTCCHDKSLRYLQERDNHSDFGSVRRRPVYW